ncbi:hypothetical protein [Nitrosopumilus maritimus]|uniref:Uncharacterized protein n=1 Tax=Nitrosopumilus maritimus (strain SCM1) TaxID=436308 RepID=A9A577_NITMS|nr:hypothetical protein [Nitrosopumilus maritimus]ABX12276.1 hypothetical protein Nmar_0380 [Nitrosopumilus maritimus SCM1]
MATEYLQKSQVKFPAIVFLVALSGTTLAMWGASWDITSHLLREPETFFTPSHGILYLGVGISVISAIMSSVVYLRRKELRTESFAMGLKLIIIGSMIQVAAGPGDFYWHELFGLDGLLSPTHITLALGILTTLVGSVIGFSRINFHLEEKNSFFKIILPITYGIFWFSIMWLIFFFVLPISEGETHNFNPDPNVAIVLSFILIPFAYSLIFWTSSKTQKRFGATSGAALTFIVMNISSNIFTSEDIMSYLPWFAAPMISAIVADYIFNKKWKSKILQKHSGKIAGAILGSMFFAFSFPMLSMTFLEIYLHNDIFPYDVLPTSSDVVFKHWMMSVPGGIVSGIVGMILAPKILRFNSE